jgi:hypothetical protein
MLTAKRFIQIVREADLEDVRVRQYSGRFMYGRQCVGLALGQYVSDTGVAAEVIASVDDADERAEVVQVFRMASRDQLGLGTIVYFPSMEWPTEPVDDSSGDSEDW